MGTLQFLCKYFLTRWHHTCIQFLCASNPFFLFGWTILFQEYFYPHIIDTVTFLSSINITQIFFNYLHVIIPHCFVVANAAKSLSKDGKVVAAFSVRDLFGSLLYHSLEKKVDISEVLKYPLTPVPLSICHVDGSMQKTPKSALLKYLIETKVTSQPPRSVNVAIIDASFFLHLYSNLPSSFGGVARYLLGRIVDNEAGTINFVADKWIKPSIKDCKRQERGSAASYNITGSSPKKTK